ncbi:hypothetical protein AAF712_004857 [Marasmius tenuissimus]|uniref:Cytochrome P450 n=1 Tax=Marasmius tenuissimus TaxID=585030 RepID=A0ABR3A486_9AGAR
MSQLFGDSPIVTIATFLGIANHLYFRRYEPVRTTVLRTAGILLAEPVLLLYLIQQFRPEIDLSFSAFSTAYLIFFTSLTTSIVLYRISPFHPLANIPGPMLFKITKFWRMYIFVTGRQHLALKALHDRYGPIIRIGPNDISVNDLESVRSILGAEGLPKGPAYLHGKEVGRPIPLVGTKGAERTYRRRVWSRGFTTEAVKEYQQIIVNKAAELLEALNMRAKVGLEVDLVQWFNFFAFDFMAEMSFSGGSDMLKDGRDTHGLIQLIQDGGWASQLASQVPWLTYLATFLPPNNTKLQRFAASWCDMRIKKGAERRDLWYHLTDEAGHEQAKPTPTVVASDSVLAIIAGSDTTAASMSNFIWCILAHPEAYKRVREEVDKEFPQGTDPLLDTSRYGGMKFMNACINESLRLLPPVPTNGPRIVPKGSGGRMVSGHLVAEGTQIQVPPFCVHMNPNNFSPNPETFIPERWLPGESGSMTTKLDAFIPFSYGPANCIGKNLAKLEMNMVLTAIVQRFDLEFAKGFDWKKWPEDKIDMFVTKNEPLRVVMRPRY